MQPFTDAFLLGVSSSFQKSSSLGLRSPTLLRDSCSSCIWPFSTPWTVATGFSLSIWDSQTRILQVGLPPHSDANLNRSKFERNRNSGHLCSCSPRIWVQVIGEVNQGDRDGVGWAEEPVRVKCVSEQVSLGVTGAKTFWDLWLASCLRIIHQAGAAETFTFQLPLNDSSVPPTPYLR